MSKALNKVFAAAHAGEALANYVLADQPLHHDSGKKKRRRQDESSRTLVNDAMFWRHCLTHKPDARDKVTLRVNLHGWAVTEWVARIPGLYWLPGSARMRKANPAQLESKSRGWSTFTPIAKSQHVKGGIGTLRFPPSEQGYRLATLTAGLNASSGVPVLISPEVWEYHKLAEGRVVYGRSYWRELPLNWAERFPVMNDIPRGCLMLEDPDAIRTMDVCAPVLAHPFSIMEYWDGSAQLHAYVYATADTQEKNFRKRLITFFEEYRKARSREGIYLTSADISQPMWQAEYPSPEAMRRERSAELRLLERRIDDAVNGGIAIEALIRELSRASDVNQLKYLSGKAGIEWRRWSKGGSISSEATRLVDNAAETDRLPALSRAVQQEFQA